MHAQENSIEGKRPKVAVVLSGGGAKGFAHIGVLKILEEEGIPIDIIVGTSMGNLIGGIYSLGYNADEIEMLVTNQNWEQVLLDKIPREDLFFNDQILKQRYQLSLSFSDVKSIGLPQGIINGQNVLNIFCGLAANVPEKADFSKFPISFACVATDLETGEEVVMREGFLPTAMFSSMAIPGVFQAANHNNKLLVDGGAVNNFPADVAKQMGADIIIGVDIRGNLLPRDKLATMDGVISQMVNFLGQGKDSINNSYCDILIRPDITGYSVGSFSNEAADTLIRRGEKAAMQMKDQIRQLKEKYNLQPRHYSRSLVNKTNWLITKINFPDNNFLNDDFLKNKLNLELPGNYSTNNIKNAINRLYGYGGFALVYYYLSDNPTGKTLNLKLTPQKKYSQHIGFKANTNDAAAVLLNTTRRNYEKAFNFLSLSTELSANPGASFVAESNKGNIPTLGTEIKTKYQNYNIFEKREKLYNADLFYSSASLYFYKTFWNKLNFGAGIKEEYFDGDIFTKNTNEQVFAEKINQLLTNVYGYIRFDDMDNFYFPTKGTRINFKFSLYTDFADYKLSPEILFKMNRVIPVTPKTTLLCNIYSRIFFNNNYPLIKTTLVGGESYSQYFNHHLPFVGLPPAIIGDSNTGVGLVGLRIKMGKIHYLSLLYNLMVQGDDLDQLDKFSFIGGGGFKYSMDTGIGPIDLGIGYSGYHEKPTFSANLGYWF
ncbi:patatin-like phospholipase family protein [Tangfeifania diversioriginum]|uniref:patatin-like phospholipase family protein n=1 Tax=Tangfeifania diversioriginum TaxID=1168035 RepID=UPI001587F0A9|nr:patatin-like phospholipase family protein [Tangfeifania diversioriginum]